MGKGGKQEGKGTSGSWQTGELADGGAGRREAGAGSWRRGVGTGELAARLAEGKISVGKEMQAVGLTF